MGLQPIIEEHRNDVNAILQREWNCPPSISRGKIIDTTKLSGFVFIEDGNILGVVTYNIDNDECEIVTLNSFKENHGIGTTLVNSVLETAKKQKCNRLWNKNLKKHKLKKHRLKRQCFFVFAIICICLLYNQICNLYSNHLVLSAGSRHIA